MLLPLGAGHGGKDLVRKKDFLRSGMGELSTGDQDQARSSSFKPHKLFFKLETKLSPLFFG